MSSKNFKKELLLLIMLGLSLLAVFDASAQSKQLDIAHSAPDGVYIDLGIALANKIQPYGRITGYKVERKGSDDSRWEQLAIVRLPESEQEYLNNLMTLIQSRFSFVNFKDIPADSLWNRVERFHRLDSLGFWSGSLLIREAVGSIYFDTSVVPHKNYLYRISSVDSSDEILTSAESSPVQVPGIYMGGSLTLSTRSATEKDISISWRSSSDFSPTSVKVFKSEGAGKESDQIFPLVIVSASNDSSYYSMTDTLVKPDTYYKYFAVPVDFYGNVGNKTDDVLIASSDFSVKGYPYLVAALGIDSINAIQVSWVLQNRELVNHLEIYRSVYFDSGFVKVADIPADETVYIDFNIKPMQKYEYYVQSVSMLGVKTAPSVKTFAMIRSYVLPSAPANLRSESLSNGVKLQWENTEDFIEGFWVYRSNSNTDSLELVSSLISETKPVNTYYDTTGLSGKMTYAYSVRSSSTSHILSGFSDTIFVRPDIRTIPPVPLELTAVMNTDSTVLVSWYDMTAVDSSVFGYNVLRKTLRNQSSTEFIKINDTLLTFTQNFFVDKTVEPGNRYQYAVTVVDVYGGQSDLSEVSVSYPFPRPVPVAGLFVTSSQQGIEISWTESGEKDIIKYNVYRQTRNAGPEMIGSVSSGSEMSLTDQQVKKSSLYFYYVTVLNKYDIESEPGTTVSIIP